MVKALLLLFLLASTNTLVQAMDQGVLEVIKKSYCRLLLQRLLLEGQQGRSIIELHIYVSKCKILCISI